MNARRCVVPRIVICNRTALGLQKELKRLGHERYGARCVGHFATGKVQGVGMTCE
jgi:hypothetical protein